MKKCRWCNYLLNNEDWNHCGKCGKPLKKFEEHDALEQTRYLMKMRKEEGKE